MYRNLRIQSAFIVTTAIACLMATPAATAKCPTSKITIRGEEPGQMLEITAAAVVRQFNVWNGPGVRVNDEPVHLDPDRQDGNFIDWPSGPVTPAPHGGDRFSVAFYCTIDEAGQSRKMYEVDYLIDSQHDGGFIYLPGPGDPRMRANTATIVHDVEGNWYLSSATWEALIRPLILAAVGD